MFEPLDGGLRIVRTVHAPRAEVFDAWVDPDRLRAWWGPPGFTVAELDADLRVGGHYRIVMQPPEGDALELLWTFREISPPERLVYGWRWTRGPYEPHESTVTVLFRDAGERTEVELTHVGLPDDAARDVHAEGWAGCLERLRATLNQVV